MRYALIDNSTLTGMQRLLGEIQVQNDAIIDNDLIAFENYIQAILFYDTVICIDDYKERFRQNRINFFPNIRFISKNLFDYDSFIITANDVTKDIILKINGGKISDNDFKEYFDKLQMTFQFTWDMSSSNYFLTQKMLLGSDSILSHEQFSKLHSLLFKENNEQYEVQTPLVSKHPKLYDSNGNEIYINPDNGKISHVDGDGLSPQFSALSSSLNWISQRTAFYSLAAEYLHADLFLQPIRQSFLKSIIKRTHPSYNLGVFNDFRSSINKQSEESVKNILSNSENFDISVEMPLFTAYFAMKTNDPSRIIDAALNERENKSFMEARTKLRELNQLFENKERFKFIREINLLTSDINKNFQKLESKYGLGENQGIATSHVKFLFSNIPILKDFDIPEELDVRIKQLEFMKHIVPRKGFNAVYRNVIEDLFEFERLGKYKDILLKNVNYSEQSSFQKIKTEEKRFAKSSSYWKKPM